MQRNWSICVSVPFWFEVNNNVLEELVIILIVDPLFKLLITRPNCSTLSTGSHVGYLSPTLFITCKKKKKKKISRTHLFHKTDTLYFFVLFSLTNETRKLLACSYTVQAVAAMRLLRKIRGTTPLKNPLAPSFCTCTWILPINEWCGGQVSMKGRSQERIYTKVSNLLKRHQKWTTSYLTHII